MRTLLAACSLAVLVVLLSGCGSPPATTTTTTGQPQDAPVAVTGAQSLVDALAAAQPSGGIPKHLTAEPFGDRLREEGDFDVSAYFEVLTHLSVEPGYVVDYLYQIDGMGGSPFIYARPAGRAPYATLEQYVEATPVPGEASSTRDYSLEYLKHLKTDDTREGYFQCVALLIMGGQFYQYWHSAYDDTMPVCDKDGLERTMSAAGSAFEADGLPENVQKQARKLDLNPTVAFLDASTAVVRVVTFSKWGGFEESSYTISRQFPHKLLGATTRTLVEYDCGVMF